MKRMDLKVVGRISLCFLLLAAGCDRAYARPYFGSSIKATVVNKATGRPLEGVVVVARWDSVTPGVSLPVVYSEHSGGPQDLCRKLVNLLTAITDKNGVLQFPGWGPKDGCLFLQGDQPQLVLYKPGFQLMQLQSTSSWNGKSIQMTPAGSHWIIPDPQVDSLDRFIQTMAFHGCFWDEARPAFLMAMQEERRLGTVNDGNDDENQYPNVEEPIESQAGPLSAIKIPGLEWCKAPAGYLQGLMAEADKTSREVSLPRFLYESPEYAFEASNPNPWTMPDQDVPSGDDLVPGSPAETGIIYHVNLQYPEKPYFARIYMTLPLDPKVVSGYLGVSHNPTIGQPMCAEFNAPTTAGLDPPYLYVAPPGVDKEGKVPAGYPVCYVLKVLGGPKDSIAMRAKDYPADDYYAHWMTYNSATRTYFITEQMLYRQQSVTVPEYIEIDAPPGAQIVTDLTPTSNPRRWLLPRFAPVYEVSSEALMRNRSSLTPLAAPGPRPTASFAMRVTMPVIAGRPASTQAVPQPYTGQIRVGHPSEYQIQAATPAPAATTH
jgi:hypothetical protein